jgi:hypothetical protein
MALFIKLYDKIIILHCRGVSLRKHRALQAGSIKKTFRKRSVDPRSGLEWGHHVHVNAVQKAVKQAVRQGGLEKPASCHSLRHSFRSMSKADQRHVFQRRYKASFGFRRHRLRLFQPRLEAVFFSVQCTVGSEPVTSKPLTGTRKGAPPSSEWAVDHNDWPG